MSLSNFWQIQYINDNLYKSNNKRFIQLFHYIFWHRGWKLEFIFPNFFLQTMKIITIAVMKTSFDATITSTVIGKIPCDNDDTVSE